MRKILLAALLFIVLASLSCAGQPNQKVLRSNVRSIDVREGSLLRKKYWTASPELKKDVYYMHRFSEEKSITFISDTDSVSFRLQPGGTVTFIILLNGKDSCRTEISTLRSTYYKTPRQVIDRDTIPFEFGRDGRIYINGRINDSPLLRFLFDNGADNTIVFPSALVKGTKIEFGDSIENNSTGGSGQRRTSNSNNLQIGKMKWKGELVMFVDKQIGDRADGTVGYDVFEDKVVEIDYETRLMIIHQAPFKMKPGYQEFKMDLSDSQVPFLHATMTIDGSKFPKSFMFDMGATGCLFLNYQYVMKNALDKKMKIIGNAQRTGAGANALQTKIALLPVLEIGNVALHDLPVNIQTMKGYNEYDAEEFGMEILHRFNTVLDYQQNKVYLKPNKFINWPYRQTGKQ